MSVNRDLKAWKDTHETDNREDFRDWGKWPQGRILDLSVMLDFFFFNDDHVFMYYLCS